MNYIDKINNAIREQVELGKKDFVIYPFGEQGKLAKQILNILYGIQEKFIIDNKLSISDNKFKNIKYLEEIDCTKYTFLLSSDNKNIYNEIRKRLYEYVPKENVVDIFSPSLYLNNNNYYAPLHFDEVRLSTLECLSREIYKNNIKGEVAEAGVFRGEFAQYINRLFPDKKLYLFDTFEGFDAGDSSYDVEYGFSTGDEDWRDTSIDVVLEKMIYKNNCIIKKGYFPESAEGIDEKFCFVSLDMDLYKPIYEGLKFFYPKVVQGGYIYVHDCRNPDYKGASKAVLDFCNEMGIGYVCLPDVCGTAVIAK